MTPTTTPERRARSGLTRFVWDAARAGVRSARRGSAALGTLPARRPWHAAIAALAVGLALGPFGGGAALAAAAGAAAVLLLARARTLAVVAALLVLAGAAAGQARVHSIDAPSKRVEDGASLSARAYISARPRPSPFGSAAEVEVGGGRLAGGRLVARASRWMAWPRGGAPGTEVVLRGTLRRRRSRPPRAGGGFDLAAFMRRRGLAGELLLDRVTGTGGRRGGLAGAIDRMRDRAELAVAAGMRREEARLLRGMVLGEDEQIAERVRDDFRASGLAHLLAVSGQNVMLLAALAAPFLAAAGLSPRARAAVLLALVAGYVPLAGAGPSLQRAGIMGAAGIVALSASRPASRSYALLLAAAATLALNPRVCEDPGWQLSFAAVGGILALAPPLRDAFGGAAPRALADGIAVTVAATLFTAPLLAHHFGSVPPASLPANLLALPAVAPAMWLGMLKIALGQLPPGAGVAHAAAGLLGHVADPFVGYIAWLAERFGSSPGAALKIPLGRPGAVLGAYAALGVLTRVLAWVARRAEPRSAAAAAAWRRLPRDRRGAAIAAACAGAALLAVRALTPPSPPGALTVSFLDVGQGDATLIQDARGAAVLFDGGPPEAAVTRLLRKAGVNRLAVVVATHQSRDHHGGLLDVVERYPVGVLLDGGDGTRDPSFRAVERAAARHHVRRIRATAPLRLQAGQLSIAVLSPPPRQPGPTPDDPNPRAVIAVVSSGWFDLLLSADAESEALAPLDLPDVDAIKVPHHGSADPGLPKVLERLRPKLAAIEVGEHNTYGHPAPSTLAALRRARVRTYRTDRDGTVRLTVGRTGMRVATER